MMRNTIILLLLLSGFQFSQAQDIHFIQEDISIGQSEACAPFYAVSGVINNTGTEQTIVWERMENNMPCDWQNSVCDINLCYAPGVDSNSFILAHGDTMYLSINFYPQSQEAEGFVLMRAYVQDDPGIADTLKFVGVGIACEGSEPCVTGVSPITIEQLQVFPNPFESILYFKDLPAYANVSIYNLQGQLQMKASGLPIGSIDLSYLKNGTYLLHVESGDSFYRAIVIKE